MNSGSLKLAQKNIDKIPTKNLDSATLQALKDFKENFADMVRAKMLEPSPTIKTTPNDEIENMLKAGENLKSKVATPNNLTEFNIDKNIKEQGGIRAEKITADLQKLYNNHSEMFKDVKDLKDLINVVLKNPELIKDMEKWDGALYAKSLDNKKMGDVGILRDDGKIIHANKKKWNSDFKKSKEADSGDALHPHTELGESHVGRGVNVGSDELLSTPREMIPNPTAKSQDLPQNNLTNAKMDLTPSQKEKIKDSARKIKELKESKEAKKQAEINSIKAKAEVIKSANKAKKQEAKTPLNSVNSEQNKVNSDSANIAPTEKKHTKQSAGIKRY